MPSVAQVKLNNGVTIPIIGTGAWAPSTAPQAEVAGWLSTAIKAGFRHIDTAQDYFTEKAVGQAIRESGIPRDQFFVTTKLPINHHERVTESFIDSLYNLDLEYIDLYLMHWPQAILYEKDNSTPKNPDGTLKMTEKPVFNESWSEIEKLLDTGKVRAIGVSNFSIKTLEQLLKTANVVPAVNQIELHPYLASKELMDYCAKKGIVITAYTPSGYEDVRNEPVIVDLAKKYNASPNQIILAWHVARGTVVVPKSVNEDRQKENINLPVLDEEDVKKVTALDRGQRQCNKADKNGLVNGWTYEQLGW